jgi:hypothetical protein
MITKSCTELQCNIHGSLVSVYKRMEERGMRPDSYFVRVYDIYIGDTLIHKGLGEPFTPLSDFYLKGKM